MEVSLCNPNENTNITKYVNIIRNISLALYVIMETCSKTIFGKYFLLEMERIQCIAGGFLAVVLVIGFFLCDKKEKKNWIKENFFVLIYFTIRIITLIHIGFAYTMIRSVFFEGVYMLVFTQLVIYGSFCKKYIIKGFVFFNLLLNIINTVILWYCEMIVMLGEYASNDSVLFKWLLEATYISDAQTVFMTPSGPIPAIYYSSMYSNANFLGMFTGLAVICALNYLEKNKKSRITMVIYTVFSLYCIFYSNCSSALVACIVVLCAWGVKHYLKVFSKKGIVLTVLTCCVGFTFIIFAFVSQFNEYGDFTDIENKIDGITTQRYTLWKDSYYSHEDERLLGCGNLTLEKRDRYAYLLSKNIDWSLDINGSLVDFPGPHNGYIGIISCTGMLGFIAYLTAFIKKILCAKTLSRGYWYLAIIFILIINVFECMVIINKNALCMYMFLILAMEDEKPILNA